MPSDDPSDPARQRFYSADEMVERVRPGQGTDPREPRNDDEDGVRRRKKRRTKQPIYKARLRKRLLIGAAILLPLLLCLGLYLGLRGIRSHYEGPSFASDLEKTLSEGTGMDIKVTGLKWAGRDLLISKVSGRGKSQAALQSFEVDNLTATVPLSSWITKEWVLTEIRADSAKVSGSPTGIPPKANDQSLISSGGSENDPAAGQGSPSDQLAGQQKWASAGFVFDVASILDVDINYGDHRIDNIELVLRRTLGQGNIQVTTEGGELHLSGAPALYLGSGSSQIQDQSLEIRKLDLNLIPLKEKEEPAGRLQGMVSLWQGAFDLSVDLSNTDLRTLLADSWRDKLKGVLDLNLKYTSIPGKTAPTMEGSFSLRNPEYRGETSLMRIAAATGIKTLQDIRFSRKISGGIRMNPEITTLFDLDVSQPGVFAAEGGVRWRRSNGVLVGNLQIGLAEDTLVKVPAGRPTFFTPAGKNGFCWATVSISGTLDSPEDDLIPRLGPLGTTRPRPMPTAPALPPQGAYVEPPPRIDGAATPQPAAAQFVPNPAGGLTPAEAISPIPAPSSAVQAPPLVNGSGGNLLQPAGAGNASSLNKDEALFNWLTE